MYNLPRKKAQISVNIADAEGVVLHLAPLNDLETVQLMETAGLTEDAVPEGEEKTAVMKMPFTKMVELFRAKFRGVEGLVLEGEPFNPEDPEHVDSLPLAWKLAGMTELISYAFVLPKAMEKN